MKGVRNKELLRTEAVATRMTKEERETIHKAAQLKGYTRADILRAGALKYADSVIKYHAELKKKELAK